MGLFDGASGRGELASTGHVAKLLRRAGRCSWSTPPSMARSVAAIVHGYRTFDPDVDVAGVIFNRVGSDHHEQLLREAVEPLGMPVLGALRRDERAAAPERHLGPGSRAASASRARARRSRRSPTRSSARRPRGDRRARRDGAARSTGPAWSPASAGGASAGARIAIARGPGVLASTTRRTSSCSPRPGAELAPLRPADRRGAAARRPARSSSPAASRRSSPPSSRPTSRCAPRSRRSRPPGARCWPSAAACCSSCRSSTGARCAASCPRARG